MKPEWTDSTSYSRGERGKVDPSCWETKLSVGRLSVHRWLSCDGWFVSFRPLGIDNHQLESEDIEGAKQEALKLMRDRASLVFNSLKNFK